MRQFLSFFLLPLILWAKAPLVAVNDLNPRGITANDASIITDRLRSELLQAGKVRVLERGEMDKILKEQAFQASGACDQSQCAVEMGKLLSVDRMVVGSVGRIGKLYTLSARILDVRTGEVLFSATQDNEGRLEDLLVHTVPTLANKLSDGATRASKASAGPVGFGDLYVTVEDSTAILTLDGKVVPGRSPFSIEHIEAGTHRLEARAGERIGVVSVDLLENDLQRFEIPLSMATTSMKFYSDPTEASADLDEDSASHLSLGETPVKLDSLEVGTHSVTFRKTGYLDTTIRFTAQMDKPGSVRVRLSPAGTMVLHPAPNVPVKLVRGRDTLRVLGQPRNDLPPGKWGVFLRDKAWEPVATTVQISQGRDDTIFLQRHFARIEIATGIPAQVQIDGKEVGTTPVSLDSLEPGRHVIRLRAEGHRDLIQELTLSPGQFQVLNVQLESRFAWLRVKSNAIATVELDGNPAGSTTSPSLHPNSLGDRNPSSRSNHSCPGEPCLWSSDTLSPGAHRLRVTADRRVPWEDTVTLSPGATLTYQVNLPWTPQELARQRRASRFGRRTLLGVLTAGTTAATATFAVLSQSHASKARDIQSQYDAARGDYGSYKTRYEEERSDANSSRRAAYTSGALAALAATGFILSWNF